MAANKNAAFGAPRVTFTRRASATRAAERLGIKWPGLLQDEQGRFYIAQLEPDYVDPQYELPIRVPNAARGRPLNLSRLRG